MTKPLPVMAEIEAHGHLTQEPGSTLKRNRNLTIGAAVGAIGAPCLAIALAILSVLCGEFTILVVLGSIVGMIIAYERPWDRPWENY